MLRTALLILCGALLPVAATTHSPRPDEMVVAHADATPASPPAAGAVPIPAGTALEVTVHYTGPGQVSEQRRIWIWLFDQEPDHTSPVPPVAQQSVAVNGGVATFTGISASRVWVTVIYDERGGFTADSPPPSGSPAGAHAVDGQMAPVAPGPNAAVQITFNDQFRIP